MGKICLRWLAMGLCGALLSAGSVQAVDQGVTGKKLLLKNQKKTVVISKDPTVSIMGSDPVNGGASAVTFSDGTNTTTYSLPASSWTASGGGTLFKYKNAAAAPGGPSAVKIAKLKSGLLKVVAKGNALAVPVGPATIDVEVSLDGGSNRYCMSFTGTGDSHTFQVKNAVAATCPVCGDGLKEGTEACDIADDDACPFECQSDCTCPVCGDNQAEGNEECDGSDETQCPGLCLADCSCNASAEACCDQGAECGGATAGTCMVLGGTPIGGGLQCNASGSCAAPNTGPDGGCCEISGPQLCGMPSTPGSCPGTYHSDSICLPSGVCAPPCQATTGGFCWFLGNFGESCDVTCAAAGRAYDDATRTFAGSDGTAANCNAVLDDLGVSLPPISAPCPDFGGIGCAVVGGFGTASFHCLAPPTDSMSASAALRACACQ